MHYKEAYPVLGKMMDDFDSWYSFDGTEDEEEKEMYREGFARCKLNLELGEYTGEDLDYLYQIYDTVKKMKSTVMQSWHLLSPCLMSMGESRPNES